jgi:nucleoside-diphosphate-sugar epimerase
MTILVTGATGFLGSHIAEQLSQAGRPVRVLVRKSSDTKFLKSLPHIEFAYGAVDDQQSCIEATAGVTGIIHAAGLVKAKSSQEFLRVNTEGTENLLIGAQKAGTVKRFVFVSSQAVGGPSDAAGTPVRIGSETAPVTAYGRSKLAAERILLSAKKSVPVTILRPPAIYGPRDREILVFFKAVKSGVLPLTNPLEAKYSMIYGPDCAAACIMALDKELESGTVLFVDDGKPVSFREMIERVEAALGKKAWMRVPMPQGLIRGVAALTEVYGRVTNQAVMLTRDKCNELHAPGWVCDGTEALTALGWKPTVQFAEGVKLTAEWYRREGWL